MSDENNRYRRISQDELCRQRDVEVTIDDLPGYLKEAATLSERARKTHPGQYNLAYDGDEIQLLDIFAPEDADNLPVLIDTRRWLANWQQEHSQPCCAGNQ